jgi:hypothetical protein
MNSSPDKNEVEVYCDDITVMNWSGQQYLSVTSGEDHTGSPDAQKDTNSWMITFFCDRKGSNGVAGTFNGWCGGKGHEYCPTSGDAQPEELNFAFAMDCMFTVDGTDCKARLCFGQGSKGLSNNWWFGSEQIISAKELVLYGPGGKKVAAYALSGGNNDLVLTRI